MILHCLAIFLVFTQAYGICSTGNLHTVFDLHECISKVECLQKNLVIYERTCLHKCPRSAIYFKPETRECFKECPIESVINGTTCLPTTYCSDAGKLVFDRRCVDDCPGAAKLQHGHVCYDICPGDTVANGSQCILRSQCVTDSKVLDGSCVEDCPTEYLLTADNECVSVCPTGTVGEAKVCISEEECVTSRRRVIDNRSCVESCPPHSPLLAEGVCTTHCPSGMFTNGSNCEPDSVCIEKGFFVFNSTCIETCPDIAPLSSSGRCVSECPIGRIANDNVCILSSLCRSEYKVIFNGKCIHSCPETVPFIYRVFCVTNCPDGTLIRMSQCVSQYDCVGYGGFQYEDQCVNVCPKDAAYRMMNDYHDPRYSVCVIKCPVDTVRNEIEGKCLRKTWCHKDNVDAVVFNNSCADFCPSSRKYNYSSVCYDTCPEDTYAVGSQCLPSHRCTSSYQDSPKRVFHQGSCLDRCPPDAPYDHKGHCVSLCPNTTLQLSTFCSSRNCTGSKVYDGEYCVTLSTCQDEGKMSFEGECIKYCPYGYFRFSTGCRKLPHMGLSFLITGLMCGLCTIPIVFVLYSPRKWILSGSKVKKVYGKEREHCEYQLVRMGSRAEEGKIQIEI